MAEPLSSVNIKGATRPVNCSPPRPSNSPRENDIRVRSFDFKNTICFFSDSGPKKAVIEIPKASDNLYRVLTDGDVLPRSIIESALAERPLRVARVRMEIPREAIQAVDWPGQKGGKENDITGIGAQIHCWEPAGLAVSLPHIIAAPWRGGKAASTSPSGRSAGRSAALPSIFRPSLR